MSYTESENLETIYEVKSACQSGTGQQREIVKTHATFC